MITKKEKIRKTKKYLNNTVPMILLILLIIFTGCHKDYIYIANEFGKNTTYNNSKEELAFYKFIHIAKPPKNFGTSKTIFKKTALYTYNIKTNKLTEIFNFENLPSGRDNWIQGLSYQQNVLAFSIRPVNDWKYYYEYKEKYSRIHLFYKDQNVIKTFNKVGFNPVISKNENKILYFTKDSENAVLWISTIRNGSNSSKIISDSLNHYTRFIWKNDDEVFLKEPKNKNLKMINLTSLDVKENLGSDSIAEIKINSKQLNEITINVSYKEWGIDINKHIPKSKKARIKDLITGYGSETYRIAVLQEIEKDLSSKEIKMILDEIGMHKEYLSSYEKLKYENSSQILITQLKDLLKRKTEE